MHKYILQLKTGKEICLFPVLPLYTVFKICAKMRVLEKNTK